VIQLAAVVVAHAADSTRSPPQSQATYERLSNTISSLRPTTTAATVTGTEVRSHIIVFERSDFFGAHRHVLGPVQSLGDLNDRISSIIFERGAWEFFRDDNFSGPYPGHPVLGRGSLRTLGSDAGVSIEHDTISSLRPTDAEITGSAPNSVVGSDLILFNRRDFRGEHQHVKVKARRVKFTRLEERPKSLVILNGTRQWAFFSRVGFLRILARSESLQGGMVLFRPILLGPGLYRDTHQVGLWDSVYSLRSDPFFDLIIDEDSPNNSAAIHISWTGRLVKNSVRYTVDGNVKNLTDLDTFNPTESAAIDILTNLSPGRHEVEIRGEQTGLFLDHRTVSRLRKRTFTIARPDDDEDDGDGGDDEQLQ
jgi:Beta/Gamma crystallin